MNTEKVPNQLPSQFIAGFSDESFVVDDRSRKRPAELVLERVKSILHDTAMPASWLLRGSAACRPR